MADKNRRPEYSGFVKSANRELPSDDEYGDIAACDALTAAYDLEGYPAPPERKRRKNAANAAKTGCVHSSCDGTPSCPV